MRKEITEKALNIIRAKRKKNQDIFNAKMAVLENDNEYLKVNKEYLSLMIKNRKKEAYGEETDALNEERLFKLVQQHKAKYGLENVSLNYNCPICKDEGYVNGKPCKCLKAEISKLLLQGSGFEKLEDFQPSIQTAGELEPLYKKMQEWCNKKSEKNLIYFSGPTGIGKTHLLECMANEFIVQGKMVIIVTSLDLSIDLKTFQRYFDEEILKKYINADVLFIDDLGTEPIFQSVTIEYLYLIINERKMKNRRTVITSNLTFNDVYERYDERIFSRITDQKTSICINIKGEDRRSIKK